MREWMSQTYMPQRRRTAAVSALTQQWFTPRNKQGHSSFAPFMSARFCCWEITFPLQKSSRDQLKGEKTQERSWRYGKVDNPDWRIVRWKIMWRWDCAYHHVVVVKRPISCCPLIRTSPTPNASRKTRNPLVIDVIKKISNQNILAKNVPFCNGMNNWNAAEAFRKRYFNRKWRQRVCFVL